MAKRRRKYYIDTVQSIELFGAYGLDARIINEYCIRVWQKGIRTFFDWYHTQGTIVVNKDGSNLRVNAEIGDPEDMALFINKYPK
jgi:hypothetical protein